jgi:hypothetical protein
MGRELSHLGLRALADIDPGGMDAKMFQLAKLTPGAEADVEQLRPIRREIGQGLGDEGLLRGAPERLPLPRVVPCGRRVISLLRREDPFGGDAARRVRARYSLASSLSNKASARCGSLRAARVSKRTRASKLARAMVASSSMSLLTLIALDFARALSLHRLRKPSNTSPRAASERTPPANSSPRLRRCCPGFETGKESVQRAPDLVLVGCEVRDRFGKHRRAHRTHFCQAHHQRSPPDSHGDLDGRCAFVVDQRRYKHGVEAQIVGLEHDEVRREEPRRVGRITVDLELFHSPATQIFTEYAAFGDARIVHRDRVGVLLRPSPRALLCRRRVGHLSQVTGDNPQRSSSIRVGQGDAHADFRRIIDRDPGRPCPRQQLGIDLDTHFDLAQWAQFTPLGAVRNRQLRVLLLL